MSMRVVYAAAAAVALAVGFAGDALAQAAKGEPVRIPHVTTYSGPSAGWGETMSKAAQIAA
ncbi:MAG: hypothetical protein FJX61_16280, partial [Alphaproteobacteria bacterium]|nr:hypothetical protein [Alphaproteobacteria bacterium]